MLLVNLRQLQDYAAEHGIVIPVFNDPRALFLSGMDELGTLVRDRFKTAGHGRRIEPIPLAEMAQRYADGALDPHLKAA